MNTSQTATSGAEIFWRGVLAGFTTATPLPAGLRTSARGGVRGRQSASLRLRIAAATALRDFAQDANADIPAAVAAAWAICLSRFGSQEDVLFGFALDATTPVPLRLRLDSDRPLKAWLADVANQLKTVGEYGAPSADELRAWSGQAAHGPLFETVIQFGLGRPEGEPFPLVIRVTNDSSERLDVVADYDGERFPVGAIPNVLDSFGMVLEAMSESSSEVRVAELQLVSAGQAAQLVRWNDTGAIYAAGKCVHEFVEEQARRTPHHMAVTFQDRSVTYEELDRRSNHLAHHLRALGAYLITGGLGGVGLRVAERLARTAQAKLILMGRTELPEKSEWQNWLLTHDSGDLVARKIRAIQQLEVLGAEVLVACGDICNREDAKRVIRQGQQRFGAIHGVIHAAGVLDDGLIQLKAKENAGRVLGPKVTGTLVLEAALEGVNLDFFVLCSSISNWLAPIGQVDYVAANAFLDAFALSRSSKSAGRVIAIDWARWRNVGMTAEPKAATPDIQPGTQPGTQVPHPFLGRCIVDSPQTALYTTEFRFEEQWILQEPHSGEETACSPGPAT